MSLKCVHSIFKNTKIRALAPLVVLIFNVSAQFVSNSSDIKTQDDCNVTNLRCGACVQMSGCCVRITCGTPAESIKKFISWCSAHCSNLPSKASHFERYLTGAEFYMKETIRISLLEPLTSVC